MTGGKKKKKQTQTLCNQVHYNLSLQFKGQQTAGTIIAMGNTSANLLFRLKFSSSVHCVLWMLAKLFFFFPQCCYFPIDVACLHADGVFVKQL